MSEYEIEVYRADVDSLEAKLLAVVLAETSSMAVIDRDIVVASALANVACRLDGATMQPVFVEEGVTGRIWKISDWWRRTFSCR